MPRHGCFPGSFDPLTVAHVAIADAARARCGLDVVDLVLSEVALAKEHLVQTPVTERIRHIEARTAGRDWLRARSTEAQLLVDIADGYDVVILGADKWHQLHDPVFYGGDEGAMRAALDRLPTVAIAARAGYALPTVGDVVVLDLDESHHHVSATAVREGRDDWRF